MQGRRTKIIATVGPASWDVGVLSRLIDAGADVPVCAGLARPNPRREDDMTTASLNSDEVRDLLVRALNHDAIEDAVTELLFEHVVGGRSFASAANGSERGGERRSPLG